MINEYLLPIYSSKQGASTLEQQLIKNLTDDNSASGIDGALRKVREIYRALCLSRSYSKETILEAYLNTISFTGTIQGVQTAANEYFNKDVSQLSLWECATIASITKNPTNYNPYTNPENLIHRRNFIMYNMWQQGVISEEDYRNGAAQPLVLAEEDSGKKPSTVTSYFTDALFNEVVQDIMTKEGISESEAQKLLYTGGFTIEATVNTKLQSQMENLMLNTDDAYFPAAGMRKRSPLFRTMMCRCSTRTVPPRPAPAKMAPSTITATCARRLLWSRWTMTATCWPLRAAWAKRPRAFP